MSTIDTMYGERSGSARVDTSPNAPFSLKRIWSLLLGMIELRKSRIDLLELTDEQLRDIGVSPEAARREAGRPFFDPIRQGWRRDDL